MRNFSVVAVGQLLMTLAAPGFVMALPINYGDFGGASPGDAEFLAVTEDSGTDATPLFEAPVSQVNALLFTPIAFASESSNGGSDATSATLATTIEADAGFAIGRIIIHQTGDLSLLGPAGTVATNASMSTAVQIEDLSPGLGGVINGDVLFAPGDLFDVTQNGFVAFSGNLVIDLTGLGVTRAALSLEHALQSASEPGTTSFIQTKTFAIEVESVLLPEPSTLAALVLVGGVTVLRRRRCAQ